jgi:hypothetical protein
VPQYIDDNAIGEDPSKEAEGDKRLLVSFTVEKRLNQALMTRVSDINAGFEHTAELMEVSGKFEEAKAERAKKLPDDPVYRDIEFITIKVPGSRDYIHRPVWAADKRRFRAKYEAWKNAKGEPFEGTPIEQLPEVKPSQITELKYVGITTIEAMAGVPDSSQIMTMMGGPGLKQRAAAWVSKNRKSSIVTQTNDAFKERDEQIAALQAQVAALLERDAAARVPEAPKKTLSLSK